ncbi:MAG: prepilin-type N-terminal cleavage/methylation domain-containing protein [Proteobacteria bacterium]|nr:prepilin-type N-terminal cleavage/methylation domain-containing protein [Pseudomonadota bacterium]HQR04205.1 prepilin-type N-terminal cleavage/methylation domain-containing protein [Rhodocyclaceae bacterium]
MCTDPAHPQRPRRHQHGLTLIELIVFIVIISVALVGVLSVLNVTVFRSADPMVRKQMLVIAEALLEEAQMLPFTYCDPADANATTATSSAGCASLPQGLGPANGETRGSATNPFNNVADYAGLATLNPVTNAAGASFPGYTATIAITATDTLNGITSGAAPATMNVLRITVTVSTLSGSDSITLEGYRTRHSPNST